MEPGQYLRTGMRSAGLTEDDLAQKLGLSVTWVERMLAGDVKPQWDDCRALETLLGLPARAIWRLYTRKDDTTDDR